MTPERAKEILYDEWQSFLENNLDYAGISDAYKLAFKALEQMSNIEDIKAEIDEHCSDNRDRNDGLYIAMKIIDKHIKGVNNAQEL